MRGARWGEKRGVAAAAGRKEEATWPHRLTSSRANPAAASPIVTSTPLNSIGNNSYTYTNQR